MRAIRSHHRELMRNARTAMNEVRVLSTYFLHPKLGILTMYTLEDVNKEVHCISRVGSNTV